MGPLKTTSLLTLLVAAACGPIYDQTPQAAPAQGPAPGARPREVSGPPGGGAPGWNDPGASAGAPAADPWSGGAPRDPSRADDRGADERGAGDRDAWREPPPPPPPPAPRPAPRPAPAPGLSAGYQQILAAHNGYRAKHCAAPLTWSPELARVAQAWADSLRDQGCKFGHSGGRYGENLAAGTSGTLDGDAVAAMWYDEVGQFDFQRGGFSMQTGHFTQLVWRGTTQLGCGVATCRGMDIWVCEYGPPGNVEGGYRQNVRPTSCR